MEEYYNPNEEKFGLVTSYLYWAFAEPMLKRYHKVILDDLLSYKATSILDVGFGSGALIKMLLERTDSEIYGVEPSSFMIRITSRKVKNYLSKGRVRLVQGNSRSLNISKQFDLIFSSFSFHHWDDRMNAIPYLRKFLSPNGHLVIYDYDNERGKMKNSHGLIEEDFPNEMINSFNIKFYHLRNSILKVEIPAGLPQVT